MRGAGRKVLLCVALLGAFALVATAGTAGAAPLRGATGGAVALSPDLNGKPDGFGGYLPNTGFPCQGGGGLAFDAVQRWLGIGGLSSYSCFGTIYPAGVPGLGNRSAFSGSGVDQATLQAFSVHGTGTISGSYTYSEPCQSTPAGSEAGTGEAIGTLTLTLPTAVGVINGVAVSSATVSVNFWWSRVGLTAVVGLRGLTVSSGANSASDPNAQGIAGAVFVPTSSPNCAGGANPPAGAINIFSGTISAD